MNIEQAQQIVFELARNNVRDDLGMPEETARQCEAIELFEKWAFDRLDDSNI